MKVYIGTKIVQAEPMTKEAFDRAWKGVGFGDPNNAGQPGYLVRYDDGYRSWSPQDVFERCYREITMNEAVMIEQLPSIK